MQNVSKNVISPLASKKRLIFFALLALAGILFMIFAGSKSESEKKELTFEDLDPAQYAAEVEERVEELCNRIDGVSYTYAVVTLKGGYRAIYASDLQSGTGNSKNQTVIIGSGSAEKGLLIGYENPEIAGIGIVCSGGDDYAVKKNIISVISSAFDIPSNKIFVAGS